MSRSQKVRNETHYGITEYLKSKGWEYAGCYPDDPSFLQVGLWYAPGEVPLSGPGSNKPLRAYSHYEALVDQLRRDAQEHGLGIKRLTLTTGPVGSGDTDRDAK